MKDQDLENLVRTELRTLMPNIIWRNDAGEYELFGKYRIISCRPGFKVYCSASEIGTFSSTKTAVSWCVADKYQDFTLARQILHIDQQLENISNDIFVRLGIANRSRRVQLREDIDTKLEPKIIRKKQLENQLIKCVNSAKYLQQRGFDNEIARSSRTGTNKTSR